MSAVVYRAVDGVWVGDEDVYMMSVESMVADPGMMRWPLLSERESSRSDLPQPLVQVGRRRLM